MPNRSLHLLLLATLLAAAPAYGLGFRVPDQNAAATARGDAFVATADNASAVYYNPAGITQLSGTEVLLGGYGISFNARVNLEAPGSKDFDNKYDPQIAPQLFGTWHVPHSPVTLGFGMYAPFGFRNRYSDDVPFRQIAKEGRIQYLTSNPVIAVQLSRSFSVAAGLTVNYAKAELVNGVAAKGDEFRFEGDDTALGFNLGAMWQPTPKHSFGLTYWSGTSLNFDGYTHLQYASQTVTVPVAPGVFAPITVPGADHKEHASARIEFPARVTAGYSFRPTPNWNLEADVDWTEWEGLDTVTLVQKSGNVYLPFNYRSSFLYEFGVTRYFGPWHTAPAMSTASARCPTRTSIPSCPIQIGTFFLSALAESMII
jgi:long-chain fatty acid transport protein